VTITTPRSSSLVALLELTRLDNPVLLILTIPCHYFIHTMQSIYIGFIASIYAQAVEGRIPNNVVAHSVIAGRSNR
jgi:hypothetical protein